MISAIYTSQKMSSVQKAEPQEKQAISIEGIRGAKIALVIDALVSALFIVGGILLNHYHVPFASEGANYLIGLGAGLGAWTVLRGLGTHAIMKGHNSPLAVKNPTHHLIGAVITTAALLAIGLIAYYFGSQPWGEAIMGLSVASFVYTCMRGHDLYKRHHSKADVDLSDSSSSDDSSPSSTPPIPAVHASGGGASHSAAPDRSEYTAVGDGRTPSPTAPDQQTNTPTSNGYQSEDEDYEIVERRGTLGERLDT